MSNRKNFSATPRAIDPTNILALTKVLYEIGKRRITAGQDVTPENIATLNRTRKAIADRETQLKRSGHNE